jgi:hypothetical protein
VHAQVAVLVFMAAIAQPVAGVKRTTEQQRERCQQGNQVLATGSAAQA